MPEHFGALCSPADGGWARSLELGSVDDTERSADLRALAADFDTGPRGAGLARPALAAIVEGLALEEEKSRNWFERFIDWLRAKFDTEPDVEQARAFFEWLYAHLPPPWVGEIVFRLLAVTVVLGALYVVLRALENRPARPARSQSSTPGREVEMRAAARAKGREVIDFETLAELPLAARPGAMLSWLIGELAAAGCLPSDSSLTNHECGERLREGNAMLAEAFDGVVSRLEPLIFGTREPVEVDLEGLGAAVRSVGGMVRAV